MSIENMNSRESHEFNFSDTEIERAMLFMNNQDYSLLDSKEKINELMSNFSNLEERITAKNKDEEPSSIQEFMLVMNNFFVHWSDNEFLGGIYRNNPHYRAYMENEDISESLNQKISKYVNSDKPEEKAHTTESTENIFAENIKDVYIKMYEAYLLMRKYTEKNDSELYT